MPDLNESHETHALNRAWDHGVPKDATAIHARWWQLETYLRELLYVELHARYGPYWEAQLPEEQQTILNGQADRYQSNDQQLSYMHTPDATARLTYLDVGGILALLEGNWNLVSHGLLDDIEIWKARMRELNKVRRRIAHCRRPHGRDLERVENTLRDIDAPAHAAIATFNKPIFLRTSERDDPVLHAWVDGEHDDASLIDHCQTNYDIRFQLRATRRPWADPVGDDAPISGQPGYLWEVTWTLGQSAGNAKGLWEDYYLGDHRDQVVFFLPEPFKFRFAFSAVQDPEQVADAIGKIFRAAVHHRRAPRGYRRPDDLADSEGWNDLHRDLDWRVQIDSAWNRVTERMDTSIFGVR